MAKHDPCLDRVVAAFNAGLKEGKRRERAAARKRKVKTNGS